MHEASEQKDSSSAIASNRTMNIVVALALMAVAAVVMVSSYRLGAGWAKDVGPDSGYFPFYVALFLFIASSGNFSGEVPGLQSVATAMGTPALRNRSTGGFRLSLVK